MNRTSHKARSFVKDVKAGVSDAVLRQKYGLSDKKLWLYKAAANEILANRQASRSKRIRKISALQFLEDIKSGMEDRDLMVKYHLAQRQLEKLFGQVVSAGLATPLELVNWRAGPNGPMSSPKKIVFRIGWKKLALPLLVVLISVGALWLTSRSVTPKEATGDDVLQEARSGGYRIISTEELSQRYRENSEDTLLVDTRQEWEFNAGHIKGAVSFPMEPTWWSRRSKRDSMQAALGPDKNRFIVFY